MSELTQPPFDTRERDMSKPPVVMSNEETDKLREENERLKAERAERDAETNRLSTGVVPDWLHDTCPSIAEALTQQAAEIERLKAELAKLNANGNRVSRQQLDGLLAQLTTRDQAIAQQAAEIERLKAELADSRKRMADVIAAALIENAEQAAQIGRLRLALKATEAIDSPELDWKEREREAAISKAIKAARAALRELEAAPKSSPSVGALMAEQREGLYQAMDRKDTTEAGTPEGT